MSWENILKKDESTELIDEFENEIEDIIISDDTLSALQKDFLEPILTMVDEDYAKHIEKSWEGVWSGKSEFEGAIRDLEEWLFEAKENLKGAKKTSGVGISTGAEAYADKSNIHPLYRDYKLKDDEQWGESPEGLVPMPLDEMYGAEW
jgi:hypothetical protein